MIFNLKLFIFILLNILLVTSQETVQVNQQQQNIQPIRITYDYENLKRNRIDYQSLEKIKNILQLVDKFFKNLIKLQPLSEPIKLDKNNICHEKLKLDYNEIRNSDLHIYLSSFNETGNTSSFSGSCQLNPQLNRPIIGFIFFNHGQFFNKKAEKSIEDSISIIIHEFTHILGFGRQHIIRMLKEQVLNDEISYLKIKSENVLRVARSHFQCQKIDEVYFSQDSHWKIDLLGPDIMTSQYQKTYIFSKFNAALLYDLGHYAEVNLNMVNPLVWGKGKGCDFYYNLCKSANPFPEFSQEEQDCDHLYKGYGQKFNHQNACSYIQIYQNGRCSEKQPIEQFKETTGAGSRCFRSNSIDKKYKLPNQNNMRCFLSECSQDMQQIKITLEQNKTVICQKPNQIIQLDKLFNDTKGYLECPVNFTYFCTVLKDCPNSCSQNGFCINEICYCLNGWTGKDCSIYCQHSLSYNNNCVTSCPIGTFQSPNNECTQTCPKSYFKNNQNQQCQICSQFCTSCYGPTNNQCLSCHLGYQLIGNSCFVQNKINYKQENLFMTSLVYKSNLQKNCLDGYFLNSSNQCKQCGQHCQMCQNSLLCTKCQSGYQLTTKKTCQQILQKCPQHCLNCKFNQSQQKLVCQNCKQGRYLSKHLQCEQCPLHCQQCYSKDTCYLCQQGYNFNVDLKACIKQLNLQGCLFTFRNNQQIICKQCQISYYLKKNQCLKCSNNCKTCYVNSNNCTSCYQGYQLNQNSCIIIEKNKQLITQYFVENSKIRVQCMQGFFLTPRNTCRKCEWPCKNCQQNQSNCTTCQEGYQLGYKNKCQVIQKENQNCHKNCRECFKPQKEFACTSCMTEFILTSQFQCIENLNSCDSSCKTCEKKNDKNECTRCNIGYFLQNKTCQQCSSLCLVCYLFPDLCNNNNDRYKN